MCTTQTKIRMKLLKKNKCRHIFVLKCTTGTFKITEDSFLDCKEWATMILKIPVPVIPTGIDLPKFWFWLVWTYSGAAKTLWKEDASKIKGKIQSVRLTIHCKKKSG